MDRRWSSFGRWGGVFSTIVARGRARELPLRAEPLMPEAPEPEDPAIAELRELRRIRAGGLALPRR